MQCMGRRFYNTYYPQNYLIRHPLQGAVILFLFSFGFTLLYHPLNARASIYFGFELTMLFYTAAASVVAWWAIILLKKIPYFRKLGQWTIIKEIVFIYLVLQMMGFTIFLLAFIIEEPAPESRWNLATFLDSSKSAFLVYILPFAFFTSVHYKFLFLNFQTTVTSAEKERQHELMVHIKSSLKKESLTFKADELIFATAEGNYVVFHLFRDGDIKRIPIRNSISNVEEQLDKIPAFFRCHRGFIINLHQVESKKGNSLGYILRMRKGAEKVPVSRNKVSEFDRIWAGQTS